MSWARMSSLWRCTSATARVAKVLVRSVLVRSKTAWRARLTSFNATRQPASSWWSLAQLEGHKPNFMSPRRRASARSIDFFSTVAPTNGLLLQPPLLLHSPRLLRVTILLARRRWRVVARRIKLRGSASRGFRSRRCIAHDRATSKSTARAAARTAPPTTRWQLCCVALESAQASTVSNAPE